MAELRHSWKATKQDKRHPKFAIEFTCIRCGLKKIECKPVWVGGAVYRYELPNGSTPHSYPWRAGACVEQAK